MSTSLLNSNKFFYHLQGEFLDTLPLLKIYRQSKNLDWQEAFMFHICHIPIKAVDWKTNWMHMFFDNFKCDINFLKIDSHMFYPWHKDIPRKVCVNVVLQGHDSVVIFRDSSVQQDIPYSIYELNYNNQAALLNINEEHCVITRQQSRAVMTLSFYDTNYQEVLDFCIKHNL